MVEQYPFMKDDGFIQVLNQLINEQVLPEEKSYLKQRLAWLQEIAGKQQPGLFGRLFGKKG